MKLKRIVFLVVLFSVLISFTGCYGDYEDNGVSYRLQRGGYVVRYIDDRETEDIYMYIPYKIKRPHRNKVYFVDSTRFSHVVSSSPAEAYIGNKSERIYFPYSIISTKVGDFCYIEDGTMKYVITASVSDIVAKNEIKNKYGYGKYIVPRVTYKDILEEKFRFTTKGSSTILTAEEMERFAPANVAYFFNYYNNPNKGYFFVDILEESGKIIEPPYEPEREGYVFDGWYKDPETTEKWDFDTDEAVLKKDENGNTVYEELCLYAGWTDIDDLPFFERIKVKIENALNLKYRGKK